MEDDESQELLRAYFEMFDDGVPMAYYPPDELDDVIKKALETGVKLDPSEFDKDIFS